MAKFKIRVTKVAYYNGHLVYPGEVINGFEGKIPSWATLAEGKLQNKENKNSKAQDKIPAQEANQNDKKIENAETEKRETENLTSDTQMKTDADLMNELETLLNESVSRGITLENAENKTIDEQIAELKILLKELGE